MPKFCGEYYIMVMLCEQKNLWERQEGQTHNSVTTSHVAVKLSRKIVLPKATVCYFFIESQSLIFKWMLPLNHTFVEKLNVTNPVCFFLHFPTLA